MMMTIKQQQQMYVLKGSTSRTYICASKGTLKVISWIQISTNVGLELWYQIQSPGRLLLHYYSNINNTCSIDNDEYSDKRWEL